MGDNEGSDRVNLKNNVRYEVYTSKTQGIDTSHKYVSDELSMLWGGGEYGEEGVVNST